MNQQKSFQKMRVAQTPKITVAVRKRPLNRKELQRNQTDIVRVDNPRQVVISEYKQKVDLTKYLEQTTFNFDYAYDQMSTNEQIYEQSVRPLIENAFRGAKISCFAYGQTGSGKTYTMKGDINKGVPGIYYLGAKEIFRYLQQPQHRSKDVIVTFYEIYCGKLYDLLNNKNVLPIRQDNKGNINVINLSQKNICSANEFLDLIEEGSKIRVTSQNNTNSESSRSHAILQITIKEKKNVFSKISFIDLAGNERGADHADMSKQTKQDGAEINKSLLSLKECIRALDQGKGHTPFRGSKLTMVLKDSFVGYCNTVMICNISPNSGSSQNTLNTLRYADRVKELKGGNQGERLTREEMAARELMLPRGNNKNTVKVNIERGDDQEDIMAKMGMARALQENQNQPEKMDIQEPKPVLFAQQPQGRKVEGKLFAGSDKRINAKDPNTRSRGTLNEMAFRGRQIVGDSDKLPLRNVLPQKIDQNNQNLANGYGDSKNTKLFNNGQNQLTLNRSQFEAMNNLRHDFEKCKDEHHQLMTEEAKLIKEECIIREKSGQANCNHYQQEIENVNDYLTEMERIIRQKEQMINMMRSHCEKLRAESRNAELVTNSLRQEQHNEHIRQPPHLFSNGNGYGQNGMRGGQQRMYLHSNANGMNFGGFNASHNQYGDQQLLEGLGDEGRLF